MQKLMAFLLFLGSGVTALAQPVPGWQPVPERQPVVPGWQPVPERQPVVPGWQPVVPGWQPVVPGWQPVVPGWQPVVPGWQPVPERQPVVPGWQPVVPGWQPVVPGWQPVVPGWQPVVPGWQPVPERQPVVPGWQPVPERQPVSECPSGPFYCFPWNSPGDGVNPVPPVPPFFEIQPKFIQPESFQGYVARGDGSTLQIKEQTVPDAIREALKGYRDTMDPAKLYVFPDQGFQAGNGSGYLIFNGIGSE